MFLAPESLIFLRSRALLSYAYTRPLYSEPTKLEAFYEQTRKVLLLYGRRAEELNAGELVINEQVKKTFKEILEVLEEKEVKKEGAAWVTLCEVVLHIAKRVSGFFFDLRPHLTPFLSKQAEDLAMVEHASALIGIEVTAVDPETQVSQVCARIVRATSIVESFWKTGEG